MITLKEASIELGVTKENLSMSAKYNKFYHKYTGEKYSCGYDIEGFRINKEKEEILVAKVSLLIEYLNKELKISYKYMGKLCGVAKQYVSDLSLTYHVSKKLILAIKEVNVDDYEKFKNYYNMEINV